MGKISSLLLGAVSGAAAAYFLTSKKVKKLLKKFKTSLLTIVKIQIRLTKQLSNQ